MESSPGDERSRHLVASWETLQRIFIRPEDDAARTILIKYMQQILFGLHGFLRDHVGITREASLEALSEKFQDSRISPNPKKKLAEVIEGIITEIAPHAVNLASPYFIGHMTSAIPFFMVHLHTIMTALNQNVVKLETSKVVSILERQILARIHRMIYQRDDTFYDAHIQKPGSTLGGFMEDGTLANLTALWVARNTRFGPRPGFAGVESEGMAAALREYGFDRAVIVVSQLGHYSLRKAGGLLGIGNRNVISVPVDGNSRLDLTALDRTLKGLEGSKERVCILALVGVAGTTETGTVDPLPEMAAICSQRGIHLHVDAAWGGPTLLSPRYRSLMAGIEKADSVTVDGHKQFYMPMGCGMIYFKDPHLMDAITYHAAYIVRPGSVDLGIRSLAGSRPAVSLVLNSALDIMGSGGYALLIDHGIEIAHAFAGMIREHPLFELVTPPMLNILTYRLYPPALKARWAAGDSHERMAISHTVNQLNIQLQRLQREAGRSFVSRTTLVRDQEPDRVVLRVVIMNPMTDRRVLQEILEEQEAIYRLQLIDFA